MAWSQEVTKDSRTTKDSLQLANSFVQAWESSHDLSYKIKGFSLHLLTLFLLLKTY